MNSESIFVEKDISEDYHIYYNEHLGEGSFATVKKGIKKNTGDVYAIKIIDKTQLSDDNLDLLYNELSILSLVDHPNIIRIVNYYESTENVYIVLEMMYGGELFEQILTLNSYSEFHASELFKPLVDAVRYCHSMGIVHRDLKPENILIDACYKDKLPKIKISDFGLARFMVNVEKLYTLCGSPNYVAPEVLAGEGYDEKVDCWSLGVILYVMLCGFLPFYGENNEELFKSITSANFLFPSPYWDGISELAKKLITNLLVKNPANRLSAVEIMEHEWFNLSQNLESVKIEKEAMMKLTSKKLTNSTLNLI